MPPSRDRDYLGAYRDACRLARLDPATGPRTTYECANGVATVRKAAARRRAGWWWLIDWGDPGFCHSTTEYVALVHVRIDAALMQDRHLDCDDPPEADLDLRDLLALRGQSVEFDDLERIDHEPAALS